MAGLDEKLALERFILDTVENLPQNKVAGLPAALVLRPPSRHGEEDLVIPNGSTQSNVAKLEHHLGEEPAGVQLTVQRAVGASCFSPRLITADGTYVEFMVNVAPAVGEDVEVTVLWRVEGKGA